MKHSPGPLPSSCLTCRQRRKKCDKGRPICDRCHKEGHKCLGYGHIPSSDVSYGANPSVGSPASSCCIPDVAGGSSPEALNKFRKKVRYHPILPAPVASTVSNTPHVPSQARLSYSSSQVSHSRSSLDPLGPEHAALVCGVAPAPSQELTSLPQSARIEPGVDNNQVKLFSSVDSSLGYYDPSMFSRLPPRINLNPFLPECMIKFILAHYEPLLQMMSFKPTQQHLDFTRTKIISRLQSSRLTHWSMYLGARIIQSLSKDASRAELEAFVTYIHRLDGQVCVEPSLDNTIAGLINSLSGGLELIFLNFLMSNIAAGYKLLRKLAPTFLVIASTEPNLWIARENMTPSISFCHTISSPIYELGRFAFQDTMSSLMFAFAPMIDYDTSSPPIQAGEEPPGYTNSAEWVHGASTGPILLIAKVNSWRARNSPLRAAPEQDWKALEADMWGWRPATPNPNSNDETRHAVERMAIQEGWRHAALIYLYMGMCGFTSDDARIQASAKQIIKLLRVLRPDLSMRIHFLVPHLMASICTPNEKHRAELRNTFLQAQESLPWLFKEDAYNHAMDHLWHGAGANGRPVRWDDYIASMRATLPLDCTPTEDASWNMY